MSANHNTMPPQHIAMLPNVSADTRNITPPTRQHSRSVPSTPSQRPHFDEAAPRSPSLHRTLNNISPRSLHSDLGHAPSRRSCKYETGMARARRRVPYREGADKLEPDPSVKSKQLSRQLEERLSKDMRELYNQLTPTVESEDRRLRFIAKLERLLCERWPESSIKVNVFGSTGNRLGTLSSDVDVCITTDNHELTQVCSIAELLASKGMERVVCVSKAKVPIVKLWDPTLQVACDLNVNNPIALENTSLIKSYVAIDERVRPLAMIIKHWAKRRILNDAALGFTLSSYTWICLTLNFLQTLKTPVLPSLQSQPGLQPHILHGVNVAFEKDVNKFADFGGKNTASLGRLLYEFFRFYAYDFDFEASVVSVRLGSHVAKSTKGWHMLQDNRLCVEEPFNINRNLANTADDCSMRGIHKELRRAFDLIVEGKLDLCCEQFVLPPDEVKPSSDFVPPQPRPIIAQAPPAQPSRGNKPTRNHKNASQMKGNNLAARRSSNPINRQQMHLRNLPFQMTPQELQNQQIHQQHLLHDQLYQQFQYLQMQEQELRARLNQQNRHILAQQRGLYGNPEDNFDSTGNFSTHTRGPLSAPLYQARFNAPSPFLQHQLPVNGVVTNPSSPHLSSVLPDAHRFSRRTTVGHPLATGSLRAQSQPARGLVSSMSMMNLQPRMDPISHETSRRSSASTTTYESAPTLNGGHRNPTHAEMPRKPSEYVGYVIGQSPSIYGYPQSASISPLPSHAGLAIGGLSPYLRSSATSANGTTSTSPVRESELETPTRGTVKPEVADEPVAAKTETPCRKQGPLIVDGTLFSPQRRATRDSAQADSEDPMTFSGSTSEDLPFDTPSSSEDNNPELDDTPAQVLYSKLPSRVFSHTSFLTERVGGASGPYSLSQHLPSVQEVRTPSPSFGLASPPMSNGSFVDKTSLLAQRQPANPGLGLMTNGVSHATHVGVNHASNVVVSHANVNGVQPAAPNSSSWQTPKKKHRKKKTVKSENDALTTNAAGGEILPLDLTQQKGG